MRKINGIPQIEQIEVADAIYIDKLQIAKGCDDFFEKRGLPKRSFKDMIHCHAQEMRRDKIRKKQWEDEYENEQDAAENWV